ncbi:MAG: hypothetical protein IPJ65_20260 [Archangiaceae bacterium]|nr:hypothetical protein [Archangiaceae bacterium]
MASILVIEDRSGSHEVLRSALVIAGHDVKVSGPRFSGRYDLALVDCCAERVSDVVGLAHRSTSRVVLYSDCAEGQLAERAEQLGAVGYLTRAQSPKTVLREVQRLLRQPMPAAGSADARLKPTA